MLAIYSKYPKADGHATYLPAAGRDTVTLFLTNKLPRPYKGGALKPKFSKPKTEIPKSLDPEASSGHGSE